MLTVLDLFSGIGGFSLGLERTGGFRTMAFCEREPYPVRVLNRHWPGVRCYGDVRDVGFSRLLDDDMPLPDVVCGGFPCQDISFAGRGAGLSGDRSGLWFEMLRIIAETRPRYVIAENVAALRGRGLDVVLWGLASIGYDAEWHCIPASAIGAPHRRDRVWIVAYTKGGGWGVNRHVGETARRGAPAGQPAKCGSYVADSCIAGLPGAEQPERRESIVTAADVRRAIAERGWWRAESGMGRTANGIPAGSHRYPVEVEPWEGDTPRTVGKGYPDRPARLRALGNSIVPHIAELIGHAVLRHSTPASHPCIR